MFCPCQALFCKGDRCPGQGRQGKTGSAEVALDYIGQLYKIERAAWAAEFSPAEIQRFRIERAEPLLAEFKAWLEKRKDQTPPKGLLGQAINYVLSRWSRLIRYLENGHITPDNNSADNAIRPFAVGREKTGCSQAARAGPMPPPRLSLIETAKACKLNTYQYLRLLFERIHFASTEADYAALLPQRATF